MAVKRRIAGSMPDGSTASTGSEGLETPSAALDPSEFWTSERELELFESLILHKPAGVSKHFKMAFILHRLSANPDFKNIKASSVWSHLDTLYDMGKVNEIENASTAGTALSGEEAAPSDAAGNAAAEGTSDFCLPLKDFYKALTEMKRTSGIQIEDANVYFGGASSGSGGSGGGGGSEKGGKSEDSSKTPGSKRPTRSTPNSTPSGSKRRK